MKYIVILGDGMADRPIDELGGKTPLQAAEIPTIDMLASKGEIGLAATIPPGMKPGSDTANLAVLGYDPQVFYSGRSPLEALSIGAPMEANDVAMRVNIVTISDEEGIPFEERKILDHSAGEIPTKEAKELLEACMEELQNDEFKFYVGTSYRHCCIWANGQVLDFEQPHDHLSEKIGPVMPADERFARMTKRSFEILNHHPINEKRRAEGKAAANCLWFWGAGTKPSLTSFEEKTGKRGAMISAVDLLKGIAIGAKMKSIDVEGANGQLETNYAGKAGAALNVLLKDGYDFVYVHVEAPDEMGHQGSIERKIKAIEYLDKRLVKPVYEGLQDSGEKFRMLIMPDHPTPISLRTHTSDPVPYVLYDSTRERKTIQKYSEEEAELSGNMVNPGYLIMDRLLMLER